MRNLQLQTLVTDAKFVSNEIQDILTCSLQIGLTGYALNAPACNIQCFLEQKLCIVEPTHMQCSAQVFKRAGCHLKRAL